MAYTDLVYQHVVDARLEKVFRHTNMFLRDLYSMYLFDASAESNGGRGNFSIALVADALLTGSAVKSRRQYGLRTTMNADLKRP